MKHAVMNDENRPSNIAKPTARITRARARALGPSCGLPPLYPSVKQDDQRCLRASLKRAAPEDNKPKGHPQKKRAVLKDVTNISCDSLYTKCMNVPKVQPSRQNRKGSLQKKEKGETACFAKISKVPEDGIENTVDEIHKEVDGVQDRSENTVDETHKEVDGLQDRSENAVDEIHKEVDEPTEFTNEKLLTAAIPVPLNIDSSKHIPLGPFDRDEGELFMKEENLKDKGIIDIDSKHKDPQMCSLYAADIYSSLFARQVDRKPSADYMEKLQRDISQGMRGILIDWLVEVSEEYRLVPDTLYLTVNLIDRFLSENYIEKQKLQLLGVTCMLISSKYEEICAPRVEEFCFITDNTYTKEEVVQMESRVLNLLRFQLSVPTVKKFLRRFIQAAQASYKVPSVELEFLANYLAELTLIEYNFLKYLPSLTAASAVFLARWTLDQSVHPWNPTMEHYTKYKASELKTAVLELQELQLNTNGGMLNAIREKYKQPKFKGVSSLRSPKRVETVFV